MDKRQFVTEATKNIRSASARAQARRELADHLAEREQFYLDAGFSAAQAEQKAIARMGDAEVVGTRLAKLHTGAHFGLYFGLQLAFLVLFFVCHIIVLFAYTSRLGIAAIREEYFAVFFALVFATVGLKHYYKSIYILSFVPWFFCVFHGIGLSFVKSDIAYGSYVSGAVFTVKCILSGRANEIVFPAKDWNLVMTSARLNLLSSAVYIVSVLIFVLGLLCILKLQNGQYHILHKRLSKGLQRAFIVLLLCFAAFYITTEAVCAEKEKPVYDKLMITAVDTEMPIELLSEEDVLVIHFFKDIMFENDYYFYAYEVEQSSKDVMTPVVDSAASGEWVAFDEDISYFEAHADIYLSSNKEYLYFQKVSDDETKELLKIIKSQTADFSFGLDESSYPINRVYVHIR